MVKDTSEKETYHVIGVMSGTSLDGIDLAYCLFRSGGELFEFEIQACETVPYDDSWKERLIKLPSGDAATYALTHVEYGHYLGRLVKTFIKKYKLQAGFVASHGHTIFHQPDKGFTSQIGDGAALAAECGLPVICDFRSTDVAYGGQGAPLVPIGDELLFGDYDYCLNLGGFGNISFKKNGQRLAFDICPVNIILNQLAGRAGLTYDQDGRLAAGGKIIPGLLCELNELPYYHRQPPKSLGREWLEKEFLPLLQDPGLQTGDLLRTVTEHIAMQISSCLPVAGGRMIITGGGAFNKFLISRIRDLCPVEIIIPDEKIINYKEALIFALLGTLRMQRKPNCLPSVTGAVKAAIGGAVYLP